MRHFRPSRILALAPLLVSATVIDRIAVVVGKNVITETALLREVRLTEFLNNQPLDESPAARRAAADRMVDQQLIAGEMKLSDFAMPAPAAADPLLAQVERRFHGPAEMPAALAKYGLTEADLRRYLLWQVAVLRFTETRFPPAEPGEPGGSANRAAEPGAASAAEDRQLDDWLKQARADTHIEFKPEAFR
jgi:hypothetical protein